MFVNWIIILYRFMIIISFRLCQICVRDIIHSDCVMCLMQYLLSLYFFFIYILFLFILNIFYWRRLCEVKTSLSLIYL